MPSTQELALVASEFDGLADWCQAHGRATLVAIYRKLAAQVRELLN